MISNFWASMWDHIPCADIDTPIQRICCNCKIVSTSPVPMQYEYEDHTRPSLHEAQRINSVPEKLRFLDIINKTSCSPKFLKHLLLSESFGNTCSVHPATVYDPFESRVLNTSTYSYQRQSAMKDSQQTAKSMHDINSWFEIYSNIPCGHRSKDFVELVSDSLLIPHKNDIKRKRKCYKKWLKQLNETYQRINDKDIHISPQTSISNRKRKRPSKRKHKREPYETGNGFNYKFDWKLPKINQLNSDENSQMDGYSQNFNSDENSLNIQYIHSDENSLKNGYWQNFNSDENSLKNGWSKNFNSGENSLKNGRSQYLINQNKGNSLKKQKQSSHSEKPTKSLECVCFKTPQNVDLNCVDSNLEGYLRNFL